MKELCVNVSDNSISNIYIENGLISKAGKLIKEKFNCKKIALVSDTNVYPIYGDIIKSQLENEGYEVFTYIFKAGEASKNTTELVKIVEFMAQSGLTREDIAVALGGGVCGDMVGFAAAVFLRGIKFVQIPTSLLAQVDSSVGGKTAVDLPQGKNLCGAFHQPSIVIIDPNVLSTLSEHFFSDGMGEVIKYGCIKSASLFELLEEGNARDNINEIITECVSIKRQVVENDEKEHGERALLNFGHTCGHAIEKLWNFETVSHGEAVGMGMVMITHASEDLGITEKGTTERIIKVLEKNNLKISDSHSKKEIISAMSGDKKRTGSGIKFVMIDKIGSSFINPIKYEDINKTFGVD